MTTTLKVNEGGSCCLCPLMRRRLSPIYPPTCEADSKEREIPSGLLMPTWCPLKSGDVVVRLVRKGGV